MIPISRPILGEEEQEAVARVLASGRLVSGTEVAAFEEEFARFVGADHAVAVGSGTAALHLGLLSAGIGPGDEVVVPSFTFAATANAVALTGARPRFADVDADTFCITAESAGRALTETTAAILAVHLYGQPAPMRELAELAEANGVAVFEDAAQAHGSRNGGRPVGSLGGFGAFSFYATKNMTTGEGGMITTGDGALASRARLLRNQGMQDQYRHEIVGSNERMTEIEAAIGRVQLRRLPRWIEARRAIAAFFDENLHPAITCPKVRADAKHVYHQYTIRVPDRPRVIEALETARVGHAVYYPIPTHRQPPYANGAPRLPVSERLAEEVLSIPVRPDLTEEERHLIVNTVNEAVS